MTAVDLTTEEWHQKISYSVKVNKSKKTYKSK